MVELQPSKLTVRVRFSLPAPFEIECSDTMYQSFLCVTGMILANG